MTVLDGVRFREKRVLKKKFKYGHIFRKINQYKYIKSKITARFKSVGAS